MSDDVLASFAARDRALGAGARVWYFPDGDTPPPGELGPQRGHEALLILNVAARRATILLDVFWSDRDVPIVCQLGRVEVDPGFAMYTTMGWSR